MARSLQVNKNQDYKSKNDFKSNNSSIHMIYGNETNKEIYINSDISNNVESEFYSDDDIFINSDKSDLNIMVADELMTQENWRNKADQPIKIKKKK
jgi:hypothetical protein